ncbi:MAG: ABC transporter ATP-binding protein [Verrucomicrobia bacterium]|nr:ABC transporter ATP-binding protein [Verrucomicrobiota bacterium]
MTTQQQPAPILSVHDLRKDYDGGGHHLQILRSVSFDLMPGETLSIVGPSGSGKTTLLGLCAGLDEPSSGTVTLAGHDMGTLSETERGSVRARHVGFVFQSFQLIGSLTALENVMIPLELLGQNKGAREKAVELLRRVGLEDRIHHYPLQLSGGEQQRVALARACVHQPAILFADEPTGNLDSATSAPIVELMFGLNREMGTTLVLVTHDANLARSTQKCLKMQDGSVIESH